jgi:hypothetical protein
MLEMTMAEKSKNLNEIAVHIAGMNRQAIMFELMNFQSRFKLDFTENYLAALSVERLRHILLAAQLQHYRGMR